MLTSQAFVIDVLSPRVLHCAPHRKLAILSRPFRYPRSCGPGIGRNVPETAMRRLGYAIALIALLVCPAAADTVLPGLVQENLLLPITLPDGSQVKLEAIVIRPDRP